MKPIKTILCPTDFSSCSLAASTFAADLAKTFGAEIELMYVFQPPFHLGLEEVPLSSATADHHFEALRRDAAEAMDKLVKELEASGAKVKRVEVDGEPHQKITERSRGVDMIVMGTHGRTGLPRFLLGSVAERVVRTAHCPVLTVPVHDA